MEGLFIKSSGTKIQRIQDARSKPRRRGKGKVRWVKRGDKRPGENSWLGRETILHLLSMHRKAGHSNLNI